MITERSIEIDADPATVWDIYADVERWPDWTASVRRLAALDGAAIEVGRRFRIEQPKMPKLDWEVTEVDPGRSWTWQQRSPGGTTIASHEVVPIDGGRTLVRQRLDQRGPIGALVGLLMKRLTVRYLALEGEGLKRASEARRAAEA
jgi:uncharacterized protein YndB with AHSA1/START domain